MLPVILLAISLSVDALGIGLSCSMRRIKVPPGARLMMCLMSLIITGLAVLLGEFLTSFLPPFIATLLGALMLFATGIFIFIQGLHGGSKKERRTAKIQKPVNIVLKSFGVTIRIIRNPVACDLDGSCHIDLIEAAYLGAALSADSLGAGLGGAAAGYAGLLLPVAAAGFQLLFLSAGLTRGCRLVHFHPDGRIWTVLSGGILLVMAVLRLIL